MNRIIHFFALAALFIISSCGNSSNNDAATTADTEFQTFGNVRLVTFRYLTQDREVIAEFEKRYRIKVDVTVLPAGEILQRVQNNSLGGDVVITPSLEDIVRLKSFNFLQPFYVDAFAEGNLDDRFMDDKGFYAGLSRWTMAAIYNPNAVAESEVLTYKGLAKLPLRGIRMGMAHPDSSGLAGVVAGLSQIVNNQGAVLWTKLMLEGVTKPMRGSDYDQLDRMLAGELDMAFVSHGAALRWFLNGDPQHFAAAETWKIKYPRTETDNVNFMNMTCVGLINNAPNRPQAIQFIDFLFQQEAQEKLGDAIFEYPTEVYSNTGDYLAGLMDYPGRRLTADQLEDALPIGWEIINRLAAGE